MVNLYRKGYHATDGAGDTPYKSVRLVDSTVAAVRTLFTPANKNAPHTLRIQGNESAMTYTVDGTALTGFGTNATNGLVTVAAGRPGAKFNLNVSPNSTIDDAQVHTFVTGGNYNTFPNLNSVGFSVRNVNDDVTVTDYKIVDVGQSAKRTLFDSTTGANYSIFTAPALPNSGITATGNAIGINPTAANHGPSYADPPYGARDPGPLGVQAGPGQGHRQGPAERHGPGRLRDAHQRRAGQRGLPQPRHGDLRQDAELPHVRRDGHAVARSERGRRPPGPGFFTGMMTFTGNNYNMFGDTEALLARMVVTYTDGSTQTVVTDPATWQSYNDGPNRYADNFQGVTYDAAKESNTTGWTTTGYKNGLLNQVVPRRGHPAQVRADPRPGRAPGQADPRGRAADAPSGCSRRTATTTRPGPTTWAPTWSASRASPSRPAR